MRASGILFLTLAAGLTHGCSTAQVRVMPADDGMNKVVVRDEERDSAQAQAVKAAEGYCRKKEQEAVFVGEASEYQGHVPEDTREMVRRVAEVAPGDVAVVADVLSSERDYQAEVWFRCR